MSPLAMTGMPTAALTSAMKSQSAVHRDHADADVLGDARESGRVQAGVVPAHAHLQRHRDRDRLDGGLQDGGGGGFVAHQGGAGGLADRHLLHRAAEIDVDQVGALVHRESGGVGHGVRIAAGELQGGDAAAAVNLGHVERLAVLPDHRPGGDHLGDDHAGAEFLRGAAKWQIGDTGHGSQQDRGVDSDAVAQIDGAQGRMCGGGTTVAHHLGKLQPQGGGRNAACGLPGGRRPVASLSP
jgi:hypothetical protein